MSTNKLEKRREARPRRAAPPCARAPRPSAASRARARARPAPERHARAPCPITLCRLSSLSRPPLRVVVSQKVLIGRLAPLPHCGRTAGVSPPCAPLNLDPIRVKKVLTVDGIANTYRKHLRA